MARILFLMPALILIASIAMPAGASASDISIVYSIDHAEIDGDTVRGAMTVTVFNETGWPVENLDLRLGLGADNLVAGGVLQFGFVEAGDGAMTSGDFRLEQILLDESESLPWRVDFDDLLGNHVSMDVQAIRAH